MFGIVSKVAENLEPQTTSTPLKIPTNFLLQQKICNSNLMVKSDAAASAAATTAPVKDSYHHHLHQQQQQQHHQQKGTR